MANFRVRVRFRVAGLCGKSWAPVQLLLACKKRRERERLADLCGKLKRGVAAFVGVALEVSVESTTWPVKKGEEERSVESTTWPVKKGEKEKRGRKRENASNVAF